MGPAKFTKGHLMKIKRLSGNIHSLLGPDKFTKGHLMKIKGLSVNVTSGGSLPEGNVIFWCGFGFFWPIQATFVVREPCCDLEFPS